MLNTHLKIILRFCGIDYNTYIYLIILYSIMMNLLLSIYKVTGKSVPGIIILTSFQEPSKFNNFFTDYHNIWYMYIYKIGLYLYKFYDVPI